MGSLVNVREARSKFSHWKSAAKSWRYGHRPQRTSSHYSGEVHIRTLDSPYRSEVTCGGVEALKRAMEVGGWEQPTAAFR